MKSFDALCEVVPPPANARTVAWNDPVWIELFQRMGTRLPEDFVQFHKTYGRGYFCSRTHPTSAGLAIVGGITECGFQKWTASVLTELRLIKERLPKSLPYPLYCEPGGLLPWARVTNGTVLCWAVRGDLVDNWKVVAVRPTKRQSEVYDMGFADFLANLCSGKLSPEWAPKGLPGTKGVEFVAS